MTRRSTSLFNHGGHAIIDRMFYRLKYTAINLIIVGCMLAGLANAHPKSQTQIYGKQLCNLPGYQCAPVPPKQHWDTLWPNYRERHIMMLLNRSNVALKYRDWVVIPNDLAKATAVDISPFPKLIYPPKQKLIVVNLSLQAFAAYNANGHMVYWGPASGGKAWCDDIHQPCKTPTGLFRVFKKEGANCVSKTFPVNSGGSPMPYCMFFHNGSAIHGAEVPSIPSTHGCVGVNNNDARWLNQHFVTADAKNGTLVLVLS